MANRINKSTLLLLAAAAAIVAAAAGANADWEPLLVGEMCALAVSLLSIGLLNRALDRVRGLPDTPGDVDDVAMSLVDRTIIGAFGGLLTGLMFLFCYYFIDFRGDTDISERHVDAICTALGWPAFSPLPALVQGANGQPYPTLLQLLPEFILTGSVIGLIVGNLVPKWHQGALRLATFSKWLRWLRSLWGSYLTFGVGWGLTIGVVFNMFIFAKSDGRPFMSIYTAVFAACVSVLCYVLLETGRLKDRIGGRMASELIGLTLAAFGLAVLYAMADQAFRLTERSYCHFYSAWDTKLNRLQTTPSVILVAAIYGAGIGVVVMSVVASYSFVESAQRRWAKSRRGKA